MSKAQRLLLQADLEEYFDDDPRVIDASNHVSFQPDEETQITYPHIVYSRESPQIVYADGIAFAYIEHYQITYIDRDPDSPIFDELARRPMCSHSTSFIEDGLHHSVFDLYYRTGEKNG